MDRWHSSVMMTSKVSMGTAGLYSTGRGLALEGGLLVAGDLLQRGVALLAPEYGVDALDGGDADAAHGVDARRLEVLDVVQLGELAPLVRGGEALELAKGLAREVATVDEEQHAARAGVLDEAVNLVAGHEGLAAAGGHLHQRPGPPLREGIFQVLNSPRLHGP